MILETVLFRGHQISTLILSDFDLPLPSGGGGAGINVDVDLVTLSRGRYEHVLTGVVSTYGGRGRSSGVTDGQRVHRAVSHGDTVRGCRRGGHS